MKAVSNPFTYICNFSLTYRFFQIDVKYAPVLPAYKRGERTDRSNYRTTSLIVSLSELLETTMFNRLNRHLNVNRILAPEQYGFRRGNNMENAIFSLKNTTLSSLNKKKVIAGLLCDISKAFNSVNHSVLLQKPCYYGFRGIYLNWFGTYLKNEGKNNYFYSWKEL